MAAACALCEPDEFISDPLHTDWTPELVQDRMIEAFEILPFISGAVGPARFKTTWPAVFQELSAFIDDLFREPPEDVKPTQVRPILPTAAEIERAEEALCWPARFLADMPKAADALNLWAACKASGHSIKKTLEDRCRRATALAASMDLKQKAKRSRIAAGVVIWANGELAKAGGDPELISAIKADALSRVHSELEKADLLVMRLITPMEAMPHIVMTQGGIDEWRPRAALLIAQRLSRHHSGSAGPSSSLPTQILSIS